MSGRKLTARWRELRRMQPILAYAASHLDADLSLGALSARARVSPFHLHRLFSAIARETTKAYTSRLRLERAGALLLTSSVPVLGIALACGFRNHETFCRAFRERFGSTPSAYRRRGLPNGGSRERAGRHADLVGEIGRCLELYHLKDAELSEVTPMQYPISERRLEPQPILVARRRVKRPEVAQALAQLLGAVFLHAQRCGAVLAGQPFTRYLEWGPGVLSIEAGLPVAAAAAGGGDVLAETLPGGSAAFTTHPGPYEGLFDAHAAVQQWIEERGYRTAGAPWEVYVTDPADYPDPKDWRTELFWPIAR